MKKKNKEFKNTSNRSVFNKLYKEKFAHCSYCKWHSSFYKNSENDNNVIYYEDERKRPNWKLVSKNKKQWMKKPLKRKAVLHLFDIDTGLFEYKLIW